MSSLVTPYGDRLTQHQANHRKIRFCRPNLTDHMPYWRDVGNPTAMLPTNSNITATLPNVTLLAGMPADDLLTKAPGQMQPWRSLIDHSTQIGPHDNNNLTGPHVIEPLSKGSPCTLSQSEAMPQFHVS